MLPGMVPAVFFEHVLSEIDGFSVWSLFMHAVLLATLEIILSGRIHQFFPLLAIYAEP